MTEKVQLIPLEDHIIVEAVEEESVTKSGIILPNSKEKPSKGKVVAVGDGKILDNWSRSPIDVKVGDIIYFTKYAPEEIDIDGNTYLVIKQSAILAKQG